MSSLADKDLIVFDLDGTLTETKSNLKPDMSRALVALLKKKTVAIIGGGTYKQFRKQFVHELRCPRPLLARLFLFPTTANRFYRYRSGWKKVYSFELSKRERGDIKRAFRDVLREIHYVPPKKVYGKVIEDRGTQVTFSALGQDIVATLGAKGVRLKEEVDEEEHAAQIEDRALGPEEASEVGGACVGVYLHRRYAERHR